MLWVLRLFGYPILTFGPEILADELEDGSVVHNTGGDFTRSDSPYSTDFADEEEWVEEEDTFGFRRG